MVTIQTFFSVKLESFQLLIDLKQKQAEIVEKIKSQIDAQSNIDKKIENNMAKINQIIEDTIQNL